ncbi:helix-turn-helix domain-containing protein [Actinophytocola sp.]|uniref:helix-turn-helix domain-containing protein n=1 Tax=Actinophytocola sp. TaxID=1872138 RepID=UPI00389A457C
MRGELAAELRRLQTASGMSLRQLERETHASSSSLSRYLSGRTVPPWSVVESLCRVAEGRPDDLRPLWERAKTNPTQPADPAPQPERTPRRHRRFLVFAGGVLTGVALALATMLVPAVRTMLGISFQDVPADPYYRVAFLSRDKDGSLRSVWMKTGACPTGGWHRLVTNVPDTARFTATSYVIDEAECPLSVFLDADGQGLGLALDADRRVHDLDSRTDGRVSSLVAYDHR